MPQFGSRELFRAFFSASASNTIKFCHLPLAEDCDPSRNGQGWSSQSPTDQAGRMVLQEVLCLDQAEKLQRAVPTFPRISASPVSLGPKLAGEHCFIPMLIFVLPHLDLARLFP